MESQNWQLITETPYFYRGFNTPPTPLNRLLNQLERYYGPWQVIFRKSISKWMRSTIATIMAQKCDVHSLKITCLLHTGMSVRFTCRFSWKPAKHWSSSTSTYQEQQHILHNKQFAHWNKKIIKNNLKGIKIYRTYVHQNNFISWAFSSSVYLHSHCRFH